MSRRDKLDNFIQAVRMELKEHRSSFIVFSVMRLSIIAILTHQAFNGNYENVYLCVLTLLLLFVPSIVQVQFQIEIPPMLEIIIFCFIFAAEILGALTDFYSYIPFWDTLLHTANGFLAAAIGFSLVWLLNDGNKVELTPLYLAIVAFCFSMTIGVIWEFMEFGSDVLMGTDHQRDTVIQVINSRMLDGGIHAETVKIAGITDVVVNEQALGLGGYLDIGLIDTMEDMFVNLIGALVFSVFGYFYAKYERNRQIEHLIPVRKSKEKDYLKPENRVQDQ